MRGDITDVSGILVGQVTDSVGCTGVTVLLAEAGAVGGIDIRGAAPGTRETALLEPTRLVTQVHALVLAGGSAFGLDAAAGVMEFLEERGAGFPVGAVRVPIVPAAVVFDLGVGDPRARPDRVMGYTACWSARKGVSQGSVGAGTGATVGKALGSRYATKGGVGSCSIRFGDGVTLGALAVVNSFGDIRDPDTGEIVAGARDPSGDGFLDTLRAMKERAFGRPGGVFGESTTLGVVATDAELTREEAAKVAQMAQNGIALVVSPAHTMFDGDLVFALSTGNKKSDVTILGALAARVLAGAIVAAVRKASGLGGIPACKDFRFR